MAPWACPTASSSFIKCPSAFVEWPLHASQGMQASLRYWGLPPQCSSLYEERYILPSQTLNSQGSSPVQETHPLLGEWKVSTPNSPSANSYTRQRHWTPELLWTPHNQSLSQIPESCRPNMEEGISLFSSLLNNKHFLIVFVHALEQQKDFAVRDRSDREALGAGQGPI